MTPPVRLFLLLMTQIASAQQFRGVNISGAEFGTEHLPGTYGTDYWYNSEATFRYFASKGLNVYRVCLRWERLQHSLGGPLDTANLGYLRQNIAWAKKYGAKIIVDIHNYGRYKLPGCPNASFWDGCAIDDNSREPARVITNDFIDLWARLSAEFRDEPAVYAYDLMNEPHDMGTGDWKRTSQAALAAIRGNGDTKLILVPGDSWSSAFRWEQTHGPQGWISDPANNFVYEAHQYFDFDESGTYTQTYDQELVRNQRLANVGRDRVAPFSTWCRNNGVRGYLGEYGVPSDPRWLAVLDRFLTALDEAGMGGAYWSAGDWWPMSYPLSVQPLADFTKDRPQLATLVAHAGAAFLWSVSAADGRVVSVTANGQAAGYGFNLLPGGAALQDIEVQVAGLPAAVSYAGPGQVNYAVPAGVEEGWNEVTVKYQGQPVAGGTVKVERLVPALYSANGDGQGVAAAEIIRVKPDNSWTAEPVARFDGRRWVPLPIRFLQGDRLHVALYGTGLRNGTARSLTIGPASAELTYFGPQPTIAGLDQVNAVLPPTLAGAGEVPVVLTVDGRTANTVTLAFE